MARRWLAGALLAAMTAAGGIAEGRELQEILKDKGILSFDETKEATKSAGGFVGYKGGKGFVFQTGDGRFETAIGGRVQVRYTLLDVDADFSNAPGGVEDSSSVDI